MEAKGACFRRYVSCQSTIMKSKIVELGANARTCGEYELVIEKIFGANDYS